MEQAILQGIHVDGLTISQEQFDYANKRISKIDDHHATGQPILRDYRDHFGQYDGIASIEMFVVSRS